MKKILLFFVFALLPLALFAAPFGFKMGMTIDEISEQCEEEPSFVKDDVYLVKPMKNHPLFSYYAVYVSEKTGLYQIRAISDSVTCNKYGTEIQNAFNSVKDRIAKTYGRPKIINEVDASSLYREEYYWFMTLKDGARQFSAIWGEKTGLVDNLETVSLECVADSGYLDGKAHLVLYYYFTNAKAVEDEQDDVF